MFGLACSCPCAEVVDDGGRMVRLSWMLFLLMFAELRVEAAFGTGTAAAGHSAPLRCDASAVAGWLWLCHSGMRAERWFVSYVIVGEKGLLLCRVVRRLYGFVWGVSFSTGGSVFV